MTTTTHEYTITRLLLEADKRRPRSQQRELGMSEVGGCRRRAGYILTGAEPTDDGTSMQAVIGTAVDEAVTRAFHDFQVDGLIPPCDLIQHEVRYAGVLGHLDWYRSNTATVDDLKTAASYLWAGLKLNGPPLRQRWQVSLYGAGLITQGFPVQRVAITTISRDTGEEHRWVAPFDPALVGDALAWLTLVRETPVDHLNRDHAPDSAQCKGCPFYQRCWGQPIPGKDPRVVLFHDRPDAQYWARRLAEAREAKTEAALAEDEAKGALEAINPGEPVPVDVGMDKLLRWKRSKTTRLDTDLVRADYLATGSRPPERVSWSTRAEFVAREPTDVIVPVADGSVG